MPTRPSWLKALCDGVRVLTHVSWERHDGIAAPLTNASNASGGIAFKYRSVLGKRDLSSGVLGRLPVGVVRATINMVDTFAIQFEGNTQFDQRLHLSLARDDAFRGGRDCPQVTGTDRRKRSASRPLQVDNTPSCKIALERARCFLFDLSPCRIGNGSELTMEIVHVLCLL